MKMSVRTMLRSSFAGHTPSRHVQIYLVTSKGFSATGSRTMIDANRRAFLGALAFGAGGLAATRSFANDGHAAGYDVAPASTFMQTVPRKSGDPLKFTFPLDSGPIKATSGGWARDFTSARFQIATDIAGAHLFVNPGGSREM